MNNQTRSKFLTIGVTGALLAGAGLPLLPFAIAHAETQASSATALLERGSHLINQHEYQTAKQVLLSIDPAKLAAADQTRLATLLQNADAGLAGMSADLTIYHNATDSLQDGHLAHAARLFQYIINSPVASRQLKGEAADNLALTQAKQQQLAPQMKSLLQDAVHAYHVGNYDQAETDLNKIQISGADLGDQSDMVPRYQYLIAQSRVQQVQKLEAVKASKSPEVKKTTKLNTAAQQQLVAQQKAQEAKAAAAEKLAAQQKQEQMAQAEKAAAAKKLADQQKEEHQKLMAQEAAANKLAEEQKAQKVEAAATAKAAEEQKAQQEQAVAAAEQRKQAEEQLAMQRAAAEKVAAEKLAHEQALAHQHLLAEQQQQEKQWEQAQQVAAAAAAAQQAAAQRIAAQQAAAREAKIVAAQKAAQEAQREKAMAAQKPIVPAQPVPAPAVAPTPTPTPIPAPAPVTVAVVAPVTAPAPTPTPAPVAPAPAPAKTTPPAMAPMTAPATNQSVMQPEIAKPTLAEIERERAAALVVRADHDLRNANYQQAVALYNDALALDPKNEAATMGLRNAQKLAMGQSPGLLSQQIYNLAIQAQRAHVLFDNDLRLSSQAMMAGKYPMAMDHANDALATVEAARGILNADDYKVMKNRANEQIAIIQRQQAREMSIQQTNQSLAVAHSQQAIERQLMIRRLRQINQLMGQAREYYKQMQYQQALDTLNQVLAIDPQNNTASFMQEMVSDQLQYNAWNKYHVLRSEASQEQDVKDEESLIPYPDLEIFPQDWPELSRMRETEQTNSGSPADQAARAALDQNVPSISVNQQPFSDVVKLLQQQTGANIVVNWNALANAGVQKQTPISLTLRGVPFEKVLSLVLQQAQGSGTTQLGYSISGGVITISTGDQLAQQQVTRVFNIQDLLVQAPNFTAPAFNLQNQSSNSGVQITSGQSGGANSSSSSNLFSGGGGGQGANGQGTTKTHAQMVTEITQLIENTVARNSWIDNGGTAGAIREINGQLVITQTPNNLEAVAGLLKQLRETRSIEISIDTRFLYVTTGFLNSFGFSWSLNFGSDFFGSNPPGSSMQPLSITNNTTTYTTPQVTGVPNSIASTYTTPSLSLSGGILSNYQLSMLLTATQLNSRNTLLEAPRVTLFNGQQATMIVEDVQNYVESFTQTAGTGGVIGGSSGVATNLDIAPLTTGLSLQVQATVSADDRYVIMTIEPSLSQLLSMQTFNVNGSNVSGQTVAGNISAPGFVQLPDTQITEVQTTVSVPDGGTLLLGGERLAGETTVEAGVPILSQIPIINRLFTNSTTTKDNVILLILVRPRIIIQKEFEKKQFGRNY